MEMIVCGRPYNLAVNAKAISAIEHEFSLGVIAIARRLLEGQLLLDEMSRILFHFIYAANSETAPSITQIREGIVENGIVETIELLIEVFSNLLEGSSMNAKGFATELAQMRELFPDLTAPAHS